MRRRRLWLVAVAGVFLVAILVALWARRPHRHGGEYTLEWDEQGPSADLDADLKLMWQTEPLRGTPDPSHGKNPRASTDAATKAASIEAHKTALNSAGEAIKAMAQELGYTLPTT